MTPERIGRYRIVRPLGQGGFATVYLGEDPGLDDLVAIKILSEALSADDDGVARFVAEARVMRNLREPGVVTVHDVGEHEGRPYFVMEYCARGALADRLEALGRPLTLTEGLGLVRSIGDAIGGMHRADPPVVHRDIKPANLLIRHRPNRTGAPVGGLLAADEELIVGDFGLAKVVDPSDTRFTLIAYTRGFAPPEQLRGDGAIGPTADVFSASAVVGSALSAETPTQMFDDGDAVFSGTAWIATGPLRTELARGLAYDRTVRHPTIRQWADALLASAGPAVTDPGPTTVAPAPPERPGPSTSPTVAPAPPGPPTSPSVAPATPPQRGLPTSPTVRESADAGGGDTVGSGRSRRRGPIIGSIVSVATALLVAVGVTVAIGRGSGIVGPDSARVGEAVAFALEDTERTAVSWRVGDQLTTDPILEFTPSGPGSVEIEVVDDEGTERSLGLQVEVDDSPLRIVGPAVLPLGAITTLSAEGTTGVPVWVLGGETYEQATIDLQPSTGGTIEVELRGSDGATVVRTFTVPGPAAAERSADDG